MAREYFNAYHSYLENMKRLSDAEVGRLFRALLKYSMTGTLDDLPGNEKFVVDGMTAQIDRDSRKYAEKCDANRKNGALGGQANATERKRTLPNAPQTNKEKEKEKTKTKEKEVIEANASCGEPEIVSPPVITLPLNDGSEYPVSQEQCQEWAGLYPAVDVIQQLRGMRGWLLSNPTKRKTQRGILRFITSWLSKEQDKGGARGYGQQRQPQSSNPFLDLLEDEYGQK